MLMNLQILPTAATFYKKLKDTAKFDQRAYKRLNALHQTLKHFDVLTDEEDMAEALLRFDSMYQRLPKPLPADEKTEMLFKMHQFFSSKSK